MSGQRSHRPSARADQLPRLSVAGAGRRGPGITRTAPAAPICTSASPTVWPTPGPGLRAIIFIIPANVLPITITTSLGTKQADTISGVIYFIQSGSWEIALVIFVASVFVPFAKLLILIFLLISVRFRWPQTAPPSIASPSW